MGSVGDESDQNKCKARGREWNSGKPTSVGLALETAIYALCVTQRVGHLILRPPGPLSAVLPSRLVDTPFNIIHLATVEIVITVHHAGTDRAPVNRACV